MSQEEDMRLAHKLDCIEWARKKVGRARVESMSEHGNEYEDWLYYTLLFLLEDMKQRVLKKRKQSPFYEGDDS